MTVSNDVTDGSGARLQSDEVAGVEPQIARWRERPTIRALRLRAYALSS